MQKTIETDGARYDVSTHWDSENETVGVNLKIQARDWKKDCSLDVLLVDNNFPFNLGVFVELGNEEKWTNEKGITETDYNSVSLVLTARADGKELYKERINSSGKFHHDLTFHIKPNGNVS